MISVVAEAYADLCVLKVGTKDRLYNCLGLRQKRYPLKKRKLWKANIKDSIITGILDETILEFNTLNLSDAKLRKFKEKAV